MNYATATRAEIRELARIHSRELQEFARAGGNMYQFQLDKKDLLDEHLALLTDEQRIRFYTIYAEETEAHARHTIYMIDNHPNETVDLNPQPSTVEIGSQSIKGILLLGAVAALCLFIAYKLAS